jgi:diaminopimelate epimerase
MFSMTMKKKIAFVKMVAAGNDFVVVDAVNLPAVLLKRLAEKICQRKYGIGADGLLVLAKSRIADALMRIFNPDGSEAEMCGNGARCFSFYLSAKRKAQSAKLKIETRAGIVHSEIRGENVKIKLTDPKEMKLDISIRINNRSLRVNFINTGVPHVVVFVQGLDNIDVAGLGRQIRYHQRFAPRGANVNFVEVLNPKAIKIRTYERGVEGETYACGTGSTAAALITGQKLAFEKTKKIDVFTQSGEVLKVYFTKTKKGFKDVWLEGKVSLVYKGEYHV